MAHARVAGARGGPSHHSWAPLPSCLGARRQVWLGRIARRRWSQRPLGPSFSGELPRPGPGQADLENEAWLTGALDWVEGERALRLRKEALSWRGEDEPTCELAAEDLAPPPVVARRRGHRIFRSKASRQPVPSQQPVSNPAKQLASS